MKTLKTATIVAIAALTIGGTATASFAEYVVVNRGPNGAGHVVKRDRIPLGAKYPQKIASQNSHDKSTANVAFKTQESDKKSSELTLITRGPNGAGFFK